MAKMQDASEFIDKKFGRLTVLSDLGHNKFHQRVVSAKCECGVVKKYSLYCLKQGATVSCGCYLLERISETHTTHGLSEDKLYNTWCGMIQRCYNPNAQNYKWYGGIGVEVCKEWREDFATFADWAQKNGWKHGLQIDKDIKGDGKLYSPDTCVFVTSLKNNRAKSSAHRFTINGVTKNLSEWCEAYSIPYSLVAKRVFKRKWNIIDALTISRQKGGGGKSKLRKYA